MARIACLGAAAQNIYLIDRDKSNNFDKISYQTGGSGVNSAVSLSRRGHETILLSNIAKDAAGEAVLACLDEEGIDSSYINFVKNCETDCSIIVLDSEKHSRLTLSYTGASAKTHKYVADDLDLIHPDWLYVGSLGGDMDNLLEFFEKAHSIGCKIMFNPGNMELSESKKMIGLLDDVDILVVNKKEAAKIVPGVILSELLSRLSNYVETVIITDGSMGGIATDHEKTYRFGLYEDVENKDATGAGDAFGAGFLAHFAAKNSFYDSLMYASANATSVVSKIGAHTGALTGKEKPHPMPIQEIEQ